MYKDDKNKKLKKVQRCTKPVSRIHTTRSIGACLTKG